MPWADLAWTCFKLGDYEKPAQAAAEGYLSPTLALLWARRGPGSPQGIHGAWGSGWRPIRRQKAIVRR